MNTDDYGDVLAIPGSVTPDQLRRLLRAARRPGRDRRRSTSWLNDKSFEGKSYGIPVVGNVQGILYNKRVWEEAGITEFPDHPARSSSTTCRPSRTTGVEVAPLYTNYKDGWPLSQWEGWRGAVTANPDWTSTRSTQTDTPWTDESATTASSTALIYDAVAQGLTEADPTTTDWEDSKRLIGDGEIATMVLGSWAIPQMAAAAEAAGASPDGHRATCRPRSQVDGKFHTVAGGDYNLGINVNSKNKATARAWIDWFNHESGFSESQVGLSPLIDGPVPAALEGFVDRGRAHHDEPGPRGQGVAVRGHRHRVRHRARRTRSTASRSSTTPAPAPAPRSRSSTT